ncbi:hypothetical protein CONPUDRAFT_136820 [Coniophora puteana RWD-64-598 SS2]|uniref:Uncharacterized protein n=1 Tax=Coniophora puteana (strain RWD-64-598) TaxID=741705 RepID=A0A5M3MT08_CONPW|nr:uncharacterized protein CONPUDRAFT_136820 [Coniophora puteana RWD-64-598 SS2]EIW82302.1 hypothetical protein CONPUDRAFT_136820 [Coniophora puteana RWD-64-598 SS2]
MAAGHSMVNVEDRRRRKTIEILAATANRALAEVSYTPQMAQKITQLQEENIKLWQDNAMLTQKAAILQHQNQASAASPSREEVLQQQVEQLMNKLSTMAIERDTLKHTRDQLLAAPTPDTRYQHLYMEYQKLDTNYKKLLMDFNSLKMNMRQPAPGMVPVNRGMVNTAPTQIPQGRMPQGQGMMMQHSQRHPSMNNMGGMVDPRQHPPGQVANSHNINVARGTPYAMPNQYPQAQHGHIVIPQAAQQQTQGHIMLNQAQYPMPARQSPVQSPSSHMQHHHSVQNSAQIPMPHSPARATGASYAPPAASPPAVRAATAGPSNPSIIDLTADEDPSNTIAQNALKRASTAPNVDREHKRSRSADQHIAKKSGDLGVVAEMVGPMQEMLGDGNANPAQSGEGNSGQMSVDDLYGDLSGNGAAASVGRARSALDVLVGVSADNECRTDAECVDLMWDEDGEVAGGMVCIACYNRYENGLQPEPKVFTEFTFETLRAHCKENHPTMWDDLQWKRDLGAPTGNSTP